VDEVRITGAALEALPIFPLPDVVLFPHALLPLHVFEPRYREMTADVLAGTRLLAVARLRPGFEAEYAGRPPVHEMAGVGYVVNAEKLPDGRYNMTLRGVARVQIVEELPPSKLYREVKARLVIDTHSARPEAVPDAHRRVVDLCDILASMISDGGESIRKVVHAMPSPAACADVVASALVREPDERQGLLEMLDPADRLERVADTLAALISRLRAGQSLN
jgi:uncharacterized protein